MKILAINGSHRGENGHTKVMLDLLGGRLFGHGHDPKAAERFPKVAEVYAAYRQAGRELAASGKISAATQRRANQEVIPVPFFGLLKRQPPFKRVMVTKARAYFV